MTSIGEDGTAVLDAAAFGAFASLFDAAELREVVEEWHADSVNALGVMTRAQASGDDAQIGELAHRTAGGGLALGATALARACETLRAAAESGRPVRAAQLDPVADAVAATYAAMIAAASTGC